METELSRRKEDWEELNKIDLEQFYKLRLSERFIRSLKLSAYTKTSVLSNMKIKISS